MIGVSSWSDNVVIPKRSKQDRDIAALLANADVQMKQIKALTAAVKNKKGPTRTPSLSSNRNSHNEKDGRRYDWGKQFGSSTDFSDKKSFMTWLHTAPDGSSTTCKKNNLTWNWCTKCVRWSPHKSSACVRTSNRKPAIAFANVCVDINSEESDVATADEWSDDDIEVSKPRNVVM